MERTESYSTADEKEFILNLGTYRPANKQIETSEDLLKRYISASKKRVRWGTVSKDSCIKFAKEELKKCT